MPGMAMFIAVNRECSRRQGTKSESLKALRLTTPERLLNDAREIGPCGEVSEAEFAEDFGSHA